MLSPAAGARGRVPEWFTKCNNSQPGKVGDRPTERGGEVEGAAQIWPSWVAMAVNTGFAGLVGWYLLTKALPKMQDNYLQSIERMQGSAATAQKEQREQYLASTKESREQFIGNLENYRVWFDARESRVQSEAKGALNAVIQHCEREAARRDETQKAEMGLVNAALRDVREVLEELRDDRRRDRQRVEGSSEGRPGK
jgi:hypothetical protein